MFIVFVCVEDLETVKDIPVLFKSMFSVSSLSSVDWVDSVDSADRVVSIDELVYKISLV